MSWEEETEGIRRKTVVGGIQYRREEDESKRRRKEAVAEGIQKKERRK
jgi:hypothetical protein